MQLLSELLFSRSGRFFSRVFEDGLLTAAYSYGYSVCDRFAFHTVSGESDRPGEVLRLLREHLEQARRRGIDRADFERCRRMLYADEIRAYDSAEEIAGTLLSFALDGTDPFPLKEDRVLPLRHSLFDRDAVLLEGMSGKVTLRSDKSDRFVTVEFPDAMKYLSIWHTPKTDAPFVAIEPWTSVPARDGVIDDLEDKRDMFMLRPLATYELIWTITVG